MALCRQPDAREGQAGPFGVSERFIVPLKPSNFGGGKGPQFQKNVLRAESREIGVSLTPPGINGVAVRRAKASIFSGFESHPATVVPAGSNRSGSRGNNTVEAFDGKGCFSDSASRQAVT